MWRISKDPIGLADDFNAYRYVGNSSTNATVTATDPTGLLDEWEQLPWESQDEWLARLDASDPVTASVIRQGLVHQEEQRTGILHHWKKWGAIAERNANKPISRALANTADGIGFVFHLPSTALAGAVCTDREGLKDALSVMSYHSDPGAYYSRIETYYGAEAARLAESQGFSPSNDPHRMFAEAGLTGIDIYGVGGALRLGGRGVGSALTRSQRIRIIEHVGLDGQIYRFAGQAGPGVGLNHLAATQAHSNQAGVPIVIHGSRQSGISCHTGLGLRATSDLDLAIVGSGDDLMRVVGGNYGRIPHVTHPPMKIFVRPSEAVDAGNLVILPVR